MTFMLEDLWESLLRIERVDLLAPIARRADAYYSERDLTSLSPAEANNRGAAFITIGETLQYEGDIESAIVAFDKAADVLRRLVEADGGDPEFLLLYLVALENLGQAQNDLGDKATALETLEEHRRICEAALTERPGDLDLELALASGIDVTGVVLYDLGELAPAGQAFRRAFELIEAVLERAPSADLTYQLASIEMRRAVILQETHRPEAALTAIEHSIALTEESLRDEPSQSRGLDGMTRSIHASILFDLGRQDEAAAILRAGLLTARQLVDEDPANAERRYGLVNLELELAKIESGMGRRSAAEAAWQRVVEVVAPLRDTTDQAYLLDSLVRALLNLGRVEEARPIAQELLAKGWTHREFRELCDRHGIDEPE